ncbi:MAG TPA: galactose oxidase early set domain-containing protein [Methylocella sp.]
MRRIKFALTAVFQSWALPRGFTKISICILAVIAGAAINSDVVSKALRLDIFRLEKDRKATVDYGYGPGAGIGPARPNLVLGQTPAIPRSLRAGPKAGPGTIPIGGGAGGFFGPSFTWPIIPLHMALLPDGRVLSYGTDEDGTQGAQFIYDIWNPKLGNGSNAHTILPNTTSTDIFCSAASLVGAGLPGIGAGLAGKLLITGGDLTLGGMRNYSNNKVNVFNPRNNTLTASGTMTYPRWYPTITSLPNGDKLVLGGSVSPGVGETVPELYHPSTGWRTLPKISIGDGTDVEWWYPQSFVGFDGATYLLEHRGVISRLTTDGLGTQEDTGQLMATADVWYPSVMMAPFKVLTERRGQTAQIVDISTFPPAVTNVANMNYDRVWGSMTLLPNGQILASGGSAVDNELTGVAYQTEIFDSDDSQTWTLGASAAIPRLYHSAALLLPDGSVLTGGGGAPGPINELNAEIYYPAYLYDGSGNPAPRPTIVSAPALLNLGQTFSATVGSNDQIGFVGLVRVGFDTHSFNPEQRLVPVPFTQSGTTITGSVDPSPEKLPPGYYMLFVLNTNGVPGVAKIISVPLPQSGAGPL